MSTTMMVIIVAIAAIVALVLISGSGGPRVTQITRERDTDDKDGDE